VKIVCVHETGKTRRNDSAVNLKETRTYLIDNLKTTMKKATFITKLIAAATLGFSVFTFAPAANATSLVPTTEGEIKMTNFDCIDSTQCIDTTQSPFAYSVESLAYDTDDVEPNFGFSRLFVDDRSTLNNNYGLGILFGQTDAGTNPPGGEYWLRPVAIPADGSTFEDGQLEVGRFLFDFLGKTVASVTLDLFDVEDPNSTQVLRINGADPTPAIIAAAGGNGNRQKVTFYNVNSFEIQLGKPGPNSVFSNTGDGVGVQASVPEPGNVVSLGILAVAGMFGLQKGKKASRAN
jgi:hypothetical protein